MVEFRCLFKLNGQIFFKEIKPETHRPDTFILACTESLVVSAHLLAYLMRLSGFTQEIRECFQQKRLPFSDDGSLPDSARALTLANHGTSLFPNN